MKLLYVLFLLLSTHCTQLFAQAFLRSPIDGVYGKDFFIINYPDENADSISFKDAYCGTKSYDGHKGTDFVIRDYKQMDSGVKVLACAPGRVFKVVDTLFDRNTESITALGFGNYIAVWHVIGAKNYYTYYAHIKKNSRKVDSGAVVTAGQVLAEVACSGDCLSPHVHLEIWTDSVNVDPFAGECKRTNKTTNLWLDNFVYDTTFGVIQQGMYSNVISYNQIRERPADVATFIYPADTALTLWFEAKGIRKGDSLVAEWYSPVGTLWYRYGTQSDADYWIRWWWSTINHPYVYKGVNGKWSVKFLRNGIVESSRTFNLDAPASSVDDNPSSDYAITHSAKIISISSTASLKLYSIHLFDAIGRELQAEIIFSSEHNATFALPANHIACYYIRISLGNKVHFEKVIGW